MVVSKIIRKERNGKIITTRITKTDDGKTKFEALKIERKSDVDRQNKLFDKVKSGGSISNSELNQLKRAGLIEQTDNGLSVSAPKQIGVVEKSYQGNVIVRNPTSNTQIKTILTPKTATQIGVEKITYKNGERVFGPSQNKVIPLSEARKLYPVELKDYGKTTTKNIIGSGQALGLGGGGETAIVLKEGQTITGTGSRTETFGKTNVGVRLSTEQLRLNSYETIGGNINKDVIAVGMATRLNDNNQKITQKLEVKKELITESKKSLGIYTGIPVKVYKKVLTISENGKVVDKITLDSGESAIKAFLRRKNLLDTELIKKINFIINKAKTGLKTQKNILKNEAIVREYYTQAIQKDFKKYVIPYTLSQIDKYVKLATEGFVKGTGKGIGYVFTTLGSAIQTLPEFTRDTANITAKVIEKSIKSSKALYNEFKKNPLKIYSSSLAQVINYTKYYGKTGLKTLNSGKVITISAVNFANLPQSEKQRIIGEGVIIAGTFITPLIIKSSKYVLKNPLEVGEFLGEVKGLNIALGLLGKVTKALNLFKKGSIEARYFKLIAKAEKKGISLPKGVYNIATKPKAIKQQIIIIKKYIKLNNKKEAEKKVLSLLKTLTKNKNYKLDDRDLIVLKKTAKELGLKIKLKVKPIDKVVLTTSKTGSKTAKELKIAYGKEKTIEVDKLIKISKNSKIQDYYVVGREITNVNKFGAIQPATSKAIQIVDKLKISKPGYYTLSGKDFEILKKYGGISRLTNSLSLNINNFATVSKFEGQLIPLSSVKDLVVKAKGKIKVKLLAEKTFNEVKKRTVNLFNRLPFKTKIYPIIPSGTTDIVIAGRTFKIPVYYNSKSKSFLVKSKLINKITKLIQETKKQNLKVLGIEFYDVKTGKKVSKAFKPQTINKRKEEIRKLIKNVENELKFFKKNDRKTVIDVIDGLKVYKNNLRQANLLKQAELNKKQTMIIKKLKQNEKEVKKALKLLRKESKDKIIGYNAISKRKKSIYAIEQTNKYIKNINYRVNSISKKLLKGIETTKAPKFKIKAIREYHNKTKEIIKNLLKNPTSDRTKFQSINKRINTAEKFIKKHYSSDYDKYVKKTSRAFKSQALKPGKITRNENLGIGNIKIVKIKDKKIIIPSNKKQIINMAKKLKDYAEKQTKGIGNIQSQAQQQPALLQKIIQKNKKIKKTEQKMKQIQINIQKLQQLQKEKFNTLSKSEKKYISSLNKKLNNKRKQSYVQSQKLQKSANAAKSVIINKNKYIKLNKNIISTSLAILNRLNSKQSSAIAIKQLQTQLQKIETLQSIIQKQINIQKQIQKQIQEQITEKSINIQELTNIETTIQSIVQKLVQKLVQNIKEEEIKIKKPKKDEKFKKDKVFKKKSKRKILKRPTQFTRTLFGLITSSKTPITKSQRNMLFSGLEVR